MNIENKISIVCLQVFVLLMTLTLGDMEAIGARRSFASDLSTHPNLVSDTGSVERTCRLFNRKAKSHILISKEKIAAFGSELDELGEIGLESVMRGPNIRTRIRGVTSGNYLCFNHKGRVVSKPKSRARGVKCEFTEQVDGNGSHYISALNPAWAVGFNNKGLPMHGSAYESGLSRCVMCFSFYKTLNSFSPARHNQGIGQKHPGLTSDFLDSFPLLMPARKNDTISGGERNEMNNSSKPHRLRHRKKHGLRRRKKVV